MKELSNLIATCANCDASIPAPCGPGLGKGQRRWFFTGTHLIVSNGQAAVRIPIEALETLVLKHEPLLASPKQNSQ